MSTRAASIAPRSAPSPVAILPVVNEAPSPASSASRRLASSSKAKNVAKPTITTSSIKTIQMPMSHTVPQAASPTFSMEGSSPNSSVTQIITSKEWVLPPRPKPGRKPSVDTPASKRKAQNRAAQRAFRERRATRVQELEEKLMEVEKENELREMGLANTINTLKSENQFLSKKLDQLRKEMNLFKESHSVAPNSLRTRTDSISESHASSPAAVSPRGRQYEGNTPVYATQRSQFKQSFSMSAHSTPSSGTSGSPTGSSSYSVQQISPAPSADSPPTYTHTNPPPNSQKHEPLHTQIKSDARSLNFSPISVANSPSKGLSTLNDNFDCGVCVKDECLCESVGLKASGNTPGASSHTEIDIQKLEETINSFKPMSAVSLPRKRKSPKQELEIDFTAKFSTKPKQMPDLKRLKKSTSQQAAKSSASDNGGDFNESSPVDNCGFCSDDTPCVCREAAKEAARLNSSLNEVEPHSHSHSHNEGDMHGQMEIDFTVDKTLPPIINARHHSLRHGALPVLHPGPSVEIREIANLTPGAVPVVTVSTRRDTETRSSFVDFVSESASTPPPNSSATDGGCTGNPGTCQQCQMDPMSTLFCTTVASKTKSSLNTVTTMLSGDSNNSSSVSSPQRMIPRSDSKETNSSSISLSSMPSTPSSSAPPPLIATNNPATSTSGMFIPCADAYKTLSRHKKFNSADFSTMLGKLTTRGMQVEVQSIANVLRELDRRIHD